MVGRRPLGQIRAERWKLRRDYFLGVYEVTQEEWEKVMGKNPSCFSRTGVGKNAVKDIPEADLKRFPVERCVMGRCSIIPEAIE